MHRNFDDLCVPALLSRRTPGSSACGSRNHSPETGKMVGVMPGYRAGCDHLVDVNKMVDLNLDRLCSASWVRGVCCLRRPQQINSAAIDQIVSRRYRKPHIRPLAVRPLNYPEREPTPWGFLFSDTGKTRAAPSQERSP